MELVLGPEMARHTTHMYGIKQLTRNIEFIFPGLLEELVRLMKDRLTPKVVHSDSEELPLLESEWVEIKILDTLLDIVRRLNQNMFVGPPLCEHRPVHHGPDPISPFKGHDKKWVKAAQGLVIDLSIRGLLLWTFPPFLRKCVSF